MRSLRSHQSLCWCGALRQSPDSLRMGLITRKQRNQRAGTFSPTPYLRKRGGGVMIEFYKQSGTKRFGQPLEWWTYGLAGKVSGGWHTQRGRGSSTPPPYPMSPFHLVVPAYILYNKPVNGSKAFLWVLWTVLKNYHTSGEDRGNPQFIASHL